MPQENKKKERVKKMIKFGKWVVKFRIPILILSFLLLIPTGIIYMNTRINYDILSYLPGDIETMKGQDILLDEFGTGAFSVAVIDGMQEKEISQLEDKLKEIDHVKDVLWYGALADISIPMDMLPDDLKDSLQNADTGSQLMIITFDTSMSADETLDAIEEIRGLTNEQCLLSGMSAVVTDIKKICNSEVIMYVVIAAGLSALVLALTMDSFLLPFIFLLSIGMAIVYNLGTNFIAGEISFVTQALAAVLQLAVTMDYSIFLWHSYQEQKERFEKRDKEKEIQQFYEKMKMAEQYKKPQAEKLTIQKHLDGEDIAPYSYLAEDGVITYNGVSFFCDYENNAITLGDMSDEKNVITVQLENGGCLKVNRDNIEDLSKAIAMFSPEDIRRILVALQQDAKVRQMQQEIEQDKIKQLLAER